MKKTSILLSYLIFSSAQAMQAHSDEHHDLIELLLKFHPNISNRPFVESIPWGFRCSDENCDFKVICIHSSFADQCRTQVKRHIARVHKQNSEQNLIGDSEAVKPEKKDNTHGRSIYDRGHNWGYRQSEHSIAVEATTDYKTDAIDNGWIDNLIANDSSLDI